MKTIEEVAEEIVDSMYGSGEIEMQKCFIAGVEFAQRWISVDEELPEEDGKVILLKFNNDSDLISTGHFVDDEFEIDWDDNNLFKITHWRPIELK